MDNDFVIKLMNLAREGYKNKNIKNYREIYQMVAGIWLIDWEKQYHSEMEKTSMYEKIKKMEEI